MKMKLILITALMGAMLGLNSLWSTPAQAAPRDSQPTEMGKRPKPAPSPTPGPDDDPRPRPKPGPREGGADD